MTKHIPSDPRHPLSSLPYWFDELIDILYEHEDWETSDILMKLAEEVGELAEQIFVATGKKNKVLEERPEHEVADVINSALAVLVSLARSQGFTKDQIKQQFATGVESKNRKYQNNLIRKAELK